MNLYYFFKKNRPLALRITLLCVLIAIVGMFWLLPNTTSFLPSFLMRQDATWATMQTKGVWRVGLDPSFPPFEFLDDEGMAVGFDVDLAKEIGRMWNLETEIVAIGFDSLLDALKTGKIDSIVSAMPYDPHMTQDYRFSQPYFEAGIRFVVHDDATWVYEEDFPVMSDRESSRYLGGDVSGDISGDISGDLSENPFPIDSQKLENKTIAVEWGSAGDMVGRRLQRVQPSLQLLQFETPDEAIDALVASQALDTLENRVDNAQVDALLIDNITVRQAQVNGVHIHAVGPALESNPYVIVMPYKALTLDKNLAQALETLALDGTLDKIQIRWFEKDN